MDDATTPRRAPLPALVAGFAGIYLIWGSTYLGIKYAVETLPPFLMAGTRFTLAGLVLYLLRRGVGIPRPTAAQWRTAFLTGGLLLLGGNGLVTWGQQTVPSGMAALLCAVTPIWMALLGWLFYRGRRPGLREAVGMAVGFAGTGLLVWHGPPAGANWSLLGVLAIAAAPLMWTVGSLEMRRSPRSDDVLLTCALQMLAGGALMLTAGTLLGEWPLLAGRTISPRSLGAFAYLTLVGSLVGFTCYAWLLRVASPTAVATYSYVNPLVAVLLGWLIAGEQLDERVALATGLIVGAVVLITLQRAPAAPRPAEEPAPPVLPPLRQHRPQVACSKGGTR
jgi:drug/metabolite transporter (DMT)-like permease